MLELLLEFESTRDLAEEFEFMACNGLNGQECFLVIGFSGMVLVNEAAEELRSEKSDCAPLKTLFDL